MSRHYASTACKDATINYGADGESPSAILPLRLQIKPTQIEHHKAFITSNSKKSCPNWCGVSRRTIRAGATFTLAPVYKNEAIQTVTKGGERMASVGFNTRQRRTRHRESRKPPPGDVRFEIGHLILCVITKSFINLSSVLSTIRADFVKGKLGRIWEFSPIKGKKYFYDLIIKV